jgi:hypothetical protein
MRITLALALALALAAASTAAQQPAPADQPATNLSVDKTLVVRGVPIGQVFERFRPQIGAYLKEIEDERDYANWKVAPSKAYER